MRFDDGHRRMHSLRVYILTYSNEYSMDGLMFETTIPMNLNQIFLKPKPSLSPNSHSKAVSQLRK